MLVPKKTSVVVYVGAKALQYLADGRIRYKLDFESDWEDLPQRLSIPKENRFHWVPLSLPNCQCSQEIPMTCRQ
ncbi:uncharacterized protein AKAME5_002560600 [Lates japonicus]|uniref:Uncharacterized protein n=1 Tax=Lates japonicus TaxID=270547 RepID=A0AAD3NGN9_LATJO|nr:uncharacterized protein AKAME5_002560600 [Lates japonicus]